MMSRFLKLCIYTLSMCKYIFQFFTCHISIQLPIFYF